MRKDDMPRIHWQNTHQISLLGKSYHYEITRTSIGLGLIKGDNIAPWLVLRIITSAKVIVAQVELAPPDPRATATMIHEFVACLQYYDFAEGEVVIPVWDGYHFVLP